MINNSQDLFQHYGVENEHELSRTVYKTTACGAWVRIIPPGDRTVEVTETWTVKLSKSIAGPVMHHARRSGKARCWTLAEIPREVQEYLQLRDARRLDITNEELDALVVGEGGTNNTKITRRGLIVFVTFKVQVSRKRGKHAGEVVLGSIVEGSDAEVPPIELRFPFDVETLDTALQNIEKTADCLWHEANDD